MRSKNPIAATMTEGNTRPEPGTLGYEWFVSGDGQRFHAWSETYADAARRGGALHGLFRWFSNLFRKLAAVCTVDGFEFYGDPGPKVSQMAAGFGAVFFQYWMGIGR